MKSVTASVGAEELLAKDNEDLNLQLLFRLRQLSHQLRHNRLVHLLRVVLLVKEACSLVL